jgi:hypothetical protein
MFIMPSYMDTSLSHVLCTVIRQLMAYSHQLDMADMHINLWMNGYAKYGIKDGIGRTAYATEPYFMK